MITLNGRKCHDIQRKHEILSKLLSLGEMPNEFFLYFVLMALKQNI